MLLYSTSVHLTIQTFNELRIDGSLSTSAICTSGYTSPRGRHDPPLIRPSDSVRVLVSYVFIVGLGWFLRGRQLKDLMVSLTHMANMIEINKVPMKIPHLKIKIVELC